MTMPDIETLGAELGKAQNEVIRLRAVLAVIRDLPGENDEWHGVDCFHLCRDIAAKALMTD